MATPRWHYKARWVALADDEVTVIASGETEKIALEDAKKPMLFRVPIRVAAYIGSSWA